MNTPTHDNKSILDDARLRSRFDSAIRAVTNNILDLNTVEAAKRGITISINFEPYDSRSSVTTTVTVKPKLVPADSVTKKMVVSSDENGEPIMIEWNPEMEGQQSL